MLDSWGLGARGLRLDASGLMRLMLDALCSVLDGVFFRNITLITRINTYLPRLGRTPAGTCPDGVFLVILHY